MRHTIPVLASAIALSTALLAGGSAVGADRAVTAHPATVRTHFAVAASGFGSRVQGGSLPTASDATAFEVIGCTNLAGKDKRACEAQVTVPGLGVLHGLTSHLYTTKVGNTVSSYSTHSIAGIEVGKVAHVSLGNGQVQIEGIVGAVTVTRTASGVTTSSKGSSVLDVVFNGKHYSFSQLGKLEIPGVVKLQDDVEEKIGNGLRVIGLRATLLDGSGAVIDLGVAQLQIRPGAL